MRHASFFSGIGGLDLGFKQAGITTVSLSEVNPYASSVLAERFVGIPNLGDITKLTGEEIPDAEIWSGGFPCQDLSVAGKRAGFDGERSVLAFSFLNLVERRRPRWLVLENVLGLFSSSGGRDFGRLLGEMDQLGYHVAWRVLDARYFGVAQRRRRVFIVASLEPDRAAEVLFECEGDCGHIGESSQAEQTITRGARGSLAIRGSHGSPSDTSGNRASDGIPRRLDNQQKLEDPQRVGNFELYDFPKDSIAPSVAAARARDQIAYSIREDAKANNFSANEIKVANALQALWPGEQSHHAQTFITADRANATTEEELLPKGLDLHRYRVCGNGVAAPVAEWIGRRIVKVDKRIGI